MCYIIRCKKIQYSIKWFFDRLEECKKKKEILFALEKKTKYHRALKKEEKKPVLPAHFERILKKSDFFFR